MASTRTASPRKMVTGRAGAAKRRNSAEEREIAELSARIDRRLHELHAQADEILRMMDRRRGGA